MCCAFTSINLNTVGSRKPMGSLFHADAKSGIAICMIPANQQKSFQALHRLAGVPNRPDRPIRRGPEPNGEATEIAGR